MNKHGLTLMEVIVSALILSIAVAGVLLVFSTEKGVVARTGRRMQAMDFARQTLEELKNEVAADTWDNPNPGGSAFVVGNLYSPDLLQGSELKEKFPLDGGQSMRDYVVESVGTVNPSIGYKKVTVEVKWDEPTEPE